jgi:hypothetical protein
MSPLLSPIDLSGAEKLEILQRLDRYRKWHSLDDKRYCLACGQVIDGHGLLIVGGTRGTGPLRLICPTNRCHAIPDGLGDSNGRSLGEDHVGRGENRNGKKDRRAVARKIFSAIAQVCAAISSGCIKAATL